MRLSPIAIILLICVVVFMFGGTRYNGGMYASWGYGGGGLLLVLALLFIFGVL